MKRLNRSTPFKSVRVKGVYGQTILDMHQQLARLLDKRRPGLGDVLAQPSINKARGEILWYAQGEGEVRAYDDLTPDEQEDLRLRLIAERAEIEAVAAAMQASADRDKAADATGFLKALTLDALPPECLFLVGGRPVVTDWGCEPVERPSRLVPLTAVAAGPTDESPPAPPPALPEPAPADGIPILADPLPQPLPAVPAAAVETRDAPSWWGWLRALLLLLLLFLLLAVLLRGCAPLGLSAPFPTLGGLLPAVPAAVPPDLIEHERALRGEIADLGAALSETALTCQAPPEPAVEPAALPDTPPTEEDRLAREGGSRGVLNVSLMWDNYNDLDLIVTPPDGRPIYFENKNGGGGFLDIDMNAGNRRDRAPIENIKWEGSAPPGDYAVEVLLYEIAPESASQDLTPFTVTITKDGQSETHTGAMRKDQRRQKIFVTRFSVP